MAKVQHGFRVKLTLFVPYGKDNPGEIGDAAKLVTPSQLSSTDGITALMAAKGLVFEGHEAKTSTRKIE